MDFGFSKTEGGNEAKNKLSVEAGEIVALNKGLLNAIVSGDFDTYKYLCVDDITCFESETGGHLVEGIDFHKFYFDLPESKDSLAPKVKTNVTMSGVHARKLGDTAYVISYVRLNQSFPDGVPTTTQCCETRVWEKKERGWKNVHVHRS